MATSTQQYAPELDEEALLELVNECLAAEQKHEDHAMAEGAGRPQRRPETDRELIDQLIADDKSYRNKGETGGLYGLDRIRDSPSLSHDGSIAVMHSCCAPERLRLRRARDGNTRYRTAVYSSRDFAREAYGASGGGLQCMDGFAFLNADGQGFIVAGGAPGRLLGMERPGDDVSDLDLFLVGVPDEDTACNEIHRLARHLKEQHGQLRIYRTERCITFVIGKPYEKKPPIQVILRLNQTISEVLHGFDLGSSAVGFDGTNVWLTRLALFAYRTRLNILDLTRRRPSYEYRIHKYYYKGFGLVLPDLSESEIYENENLVMARLTFESVTRRTGSEGYNTTGCVVSGDQPNARGAASMYERSKLYHFGKEYLAYLNCKAARREPVSTGGLCAQAQYTPGMDFAKVVVDLAPVGQYLSSVVYSSKKKETQLSILSTVLGRQGAEQLLRKSFSVNIPDFDHLGVILARVMRERAVIPFNFRGYWGDLEATGTRGAPPLTEPEWYGAEYYQSEAGEPVEPDEPDESSAPGA